MELKEFGAYVSRASGGAKIIVVSNREPVVHERLADIIIQKSTREGFRLTVTEGLWKGKPVIGGDVGGIQLQVTNNYTGYLVNTPEGAAHGIRFLFHHRDKMTQMGVTAKEFVRANFLLTRHLRDYLTLFAWLLWGDGRHTIMV